MPLAPASADRSLRHTRDIRVQAFTREDGLWELEARLTDVKTHDLVLPAAVHRAGKPVHDLWLRIAFDHRFTIVEAQASGALIPYPGACERAQPAYADLVGLNLVRGFRRAVAERFGGIRGCTHLSELATVLPTVAMQAFGPEAEAAARAEQQGGASARASEVPFFIDRCAAMRRDGDAVREYYPQWYRAPQGVHDR